VSIKMKGFDDATQWLLEDPDGPAAPFWDAPPHSDDCPKDPWKYHPGCPGCEYAEGFTDGSSK
jgi:hypothetical protein